jgi:tetratricopeptide (TPR) repeat protein
MESGEPEKAAPLLAGLVTAATAGETAAKAAWMYVSALDQAGAHSEVEAKYDRCAKLVADPDLRQKLDLILGRALIGLGKGSQAKAVLSGLIKAAEGTAARDWRNAAEAYVLIARVENTGATPETRTRSEAALNEGFDYLNRVKPLVPEKDRGEVDAARGRFLNVMGTNAYEARDYETAEEVFGRLARFPANSWSFVGAFNRACSLREAGKIEQAAEVFQSLSK